MANFRDNKARVREALEQDMWSEAVTALDVPPLPLINILLACLPQGEPVTGRAASLLGGLMSDLATNPVNLEQARIFVRRLLWHMNEESGNIGWGIPEALGEILAAERGLAEQFHRVLISYILHTDTGCDNFCDHPVIRLSCYGAVRRLIQAWPDLGEQARHALTQGAAADPDVSCRAAAAEALRLLDSLAADSAK